MSADLTLEQLLEVQAFFELPSPALVEKDYYVTKALAAIAAIETAPFRLIFGGGTSLCRAYHLIKRMSEDVDLKIDSDIEPKQADLRELRDHITDALLAAGFMFDPKNAEHRESRNESRHTNFRLPYTPILRGEGVLRPAIQIEMTVSPLYHPPVTLPLCSFVAEAYKRPPEVSSLSCVSITQMAAEKFVSLTRRTAAQIADMGSARDSTLIRHIYDLHVTRPHYDPKEVASIVKEIMFQDAFVFGNQFPAYRSAPMATTLQAINALQTDADYTRRYENFLRDMVYADPIAYTACLATLKELSAALPLSL